MHLSRLVILAGIVLAALAVPDGAHGARIGNLFSAEVPVADKSPEEKKLGSALALAAVLVKLSGDRRIARNPDAAQLLANAEDFAQQYRFTPNGTLLVGFDGRNLQRAMRQAQLPVWGADRPATLIWLVADYGAGDRELLSADSQGELRTLIETTAAERGLPLVWPLNDSIDRAVLTAADVWGGFSELVDEASARYTPDAILVGRIRQGSNNTFFGNWHLQLQGEKQEWRGGLVSSVHRMADYYAARLASVSADGDQASVTMLISGMDNAEAYVHTLTAIEKLGIIERLQVVEVVGSSVRLEIELRGNREQLRRALGFSRVLVPETEREATDMFYYRYAR